MKFLIMGAGGMAGHTMSLYLSEKNHEVTTFSRQKISVGSGIVGDAENKDFIKSIIDKGRYDAVVNCIGILNQQAEDRKDLATYLNSYFPHFLADITKSMNTMIVHISTDCVFSGEKGGYFEHDLKDGKSFYDRSKALGEIEDDKNITLRTSIVGPDLKCNGIGLFNWFMSQDRVVKGFTTAIWTGITTLQLARATEHAIRSQESGLFNLVPSDSISKYDLLLLFNRYMRNNEVEIVPSNEYVVNKSLISTRQNFDEIIPNYDTMISEMSNYIMQHQSYYPHYF